MIYDILDLPKRFDPDEIHKAIDWACLYLNIPEDVYITFEWVYLGMKDVAGYCGYDDDEDVSDKNFVIEINARLNKTDTLKTIFHELVHAKQMAEQRLQLNAYRAPAYWCGKEIRGLCYSETPWEIEAYEKELEMYKKWTNSITWNPLTLIKRILCEKFA